MRHIRRAPVAIALGMSAFVLTGCVSPGVMDYAGDLYGTSRYDSRNYTGDLYGTSRYDSRYYAGVYPGAPYPYGYRADPYGFQSNSVYQSGYFARGYYSGYPQRYFVGDPYVTRRIYHEHLRYNCPHPSHRDERVRNDRDRHDGPRDPRDTRDRDRPDGLAGNSPGSGVNLRPPPGLEPGQDNLRPRSPRATPPKHSRSVLQPLPKGSPPAAPAAGQVQQATPAPKPAAAAPRVERDIRSGRPGMREGRVILEK